MPDQERAQLPGSDPADAAHVQSPWIGSTEQVEVAVNNLREQVARLERANQTLARANQRAEQMVRRHEESLSLAVQFGSDFLFRLGKDGKFRFVAQAGAAMLGVDAGAIESRPFVDLVPQEDRAKVRGFLQETLRAEKLERVRLKLRDASGHYVDVECFFRTVPHPQTAAPEILGLARRIAPPPPVPDPSVAELGARLAHELSQPLTALGTTSRYCARQLRELLGSDHEVTQAVQQMAAQTDRAAEMIRRLRQLSTGAAPQRSSVQLHQLIEEALGSLAPLLSQAKVKVSSDLAPDLPMVQVDRIQLGQVLHNLLRNAVEAMSDTPVGQRTIVIQTRRTPTEVEVSISDAGPGISTEMLERLFQPYQTTKPLGMGLGLALCRSIVEAHQGRLWAMANQPRGATFLFALPLHP